MIYEQHKGFAIETNKRPRQYSMLEPHYHDSYELYIPLSGKSTLMIGEEIICIDPDCVVVTNAFVPHGNFSKSEHERTVIYFDDAFLDAYLTPNAKHTYFAFLTKPVINPSVENFKRIRELCKLMEKEYHSSNRSDEIFILLSELFIILRSSPAYSPRHTHEIDSLVGAVLSYVLLNYKSITSISHLAAHFYVSESYICRSFKKGTNLTLTQYINSLKIKEACDLLKNTDKSLTEICFYVGYNSYAHFCNNFSRITGTNPKDYRKNNQ